jgi:hypothetical protein
MFIIFHVKRQTIQILTQKQEAQKTCYIDMSLTIRQVATLRLRTNRPHYNDKPVIVLSGKKSLFTVRYVVFM